MNRSMNKYVAGVAAVIATILLSACAAQKGPILVAAAYDAPQGLAPSAPKVVVGLSPFQDGRGKKTSLVGERVSDAGLFENDLVIQGTVSDLVTAALKKALEARGITVKDIPAWDLSIENLKADNVDIVMGGSVTALWAKTVAQTLNVNTRAEVSLRTAVADVREKKMLRMLNLNGSYERRDLTFDPDKVGEEISAALSQTIDQIMNDEEFKKKTQ